ncbi:MAG: tetratricopeptide (TPR) repeat protein [Myxococcota bacterium]
MLFLVLMGCNRAPVSSAPAAEVLAGFQDLSGARAWYVHARTAELRGDLVEAERAMRWVGRLDRRSSWAALYEAAFYERQARLEAAETAYRRAARRESEAGEGQAATVALGTFLLANKQASEGRELLEAACPGLGCALAVDAAVEVGSPDRALELIERWKASDKSPQGARARAVRAEALGAWTLAVDDWLAVLADVPLPEDVVRAREAAARAGDVRVQNWLVGHGLPPAAP